MMSGKMFNRRVESPASFVASREQAIGADAGIPTLPSSIYTFMVLPVTNFLEFMYSGCIVMVIFEIIQGRAWLSVDARDSMAPNQRRL